MFSLSISYLYIVCRNLRFENSFSLSKNELQNAFCDTEDDYTVVPAHGIASWCPSWAMAGYNMKNS